MTKLSKPEALQAAIDQLIDEGCDPNIVNILQDLLEEAEVVMHDTTSLLEKIEIYKGDGWIFVTTGKGVERLENAYIVCQKEHPEALVMHIRDNVTMHDLDDECEWAMFYRMLVKRYN